MCWCQSASTGNIAVCWRVRCNMGCTNSVVQVVHPLVALCMCVCCYSTCTSLRWGRGARTTWVSGRSDRCSTSSHNMGGCSIDQSIMKVSLLRVIRTVSAFTACVLNNPGGRGPRGCKQVAATAAVALWWLLLKLSCAALQEQQCCNVCEQRVFQVAACIHQRCASDHSGQQSVATDWTGVTVMTQ
jgi:hypothetical protein